MNWALGERILNGVSATRLAPTGNATRAQAAKMLMTFCQTVDHVEAAEAIFTHQTGDFDAGLVENLDDSADRNFAVYQEDVRQLDSSQGDLTSVDQENHVYVFDNAGEELKSLRPGDVFVMPGKDGGQGAAVKVSELRVKDNTVTVTADGDLTLADIYEYIDIDMDMDITSLSVDESTLREGTNYGFETYSSGAAGEPSTIALPQARGAVDIPTSFVLNQSLSVGPFNANLRETVYTIHVQHQFSALQAYFNCAVTMDCSTEVDFNVDMEGALVNQDWQLPGMKLPVLGIITLNLDPVIQLNVKGGFKGTQHVRMDNTVGFETGVSALVGMPISRPIYTESNKTSDWEMTVNGSVQVMVDFRAGLGIPFLANAYGFIGAGIELTGESGRQTEAEKNGDCIHECQVCIDGDINFVGHIGVGLDVELLRTMRFNNPEADLFRGTIKLADFYVSVQQRDGSTKLEGGLGECPHIAWRTGIVLVDSDGQYVPFARITATRSDGGSDECRTNEQGAAELYLPNGNNALKAAANGGSASGTVTVSDGPAFAKLVLGAREPTVFVVANSSYYPDGYTWDPIVDEEFTHCPDVRSLLELRYKTVWIPRSQYNSDDKNELMRKYGAAPGDFLLELSLTPAVNEYYFVSYSGGKYGSSETYWDVLGYGNISARLSVIGYDPERDCVDTTLLHSISSEFVVPDKQVDSPPNYEEPWSAYYYYDPNQRCYFRNSEHYYYRYRFDENYTTDSYYYTEDGGVEHALSYSDSWQDTEGVYFSTPYDAIQGRDQIKNYLVNFLSNHVLDTLDSFMNGTWGDELPEYMVDHSIYI